jgi:NosR/NirI family transcriptional regulator, nitrous oxide reductase regulator
VIRAARGLPTPALAGARRLAIAALAVLVCAAPGGARGGVVTRAALAQWFPAPFVVGERETDLPIWPLFRQRGPPTFSTDLVGYVFESIDLAPIPGFSGTPVNLLVTLDPTGAFLDVRVLSHHEPVFIDGLGPEPLSRFVSQFKGLSLHQSIRIGSGGARTSGGTSVYIDGVAKATASVRIINQSVLSAALRVARAKLGFSGARDPDLVAHVRADLFEPHTWRELEEAGLVQRLWLRNRDVERAFASTDVAGVDPESLADPDGVLVDLYAAMITIPSAGRNLLDDVGWRSMTARINPGDQVLLVMSRGRYSFLPQDFVRGSVPDRLSLTQGGLPIEMRDLDLDAALRPIGQPAFDSWMAFRVIAQSGLDPGAPMQLTIRVTRAKGVVYPERIGRDFALQMAVPAEFLIPAAEDQKGWRAIWKARWASIAVLLLSLALLGWVLARQSSVVARARQLRWFRPAFLAFTLAFIGWHAQGQLSIVNVVALLQALVARQSWTFFLYDPMSTILWVFVLVTLVVWGRGTFCGWLCPFGALQELVASLARWARIPRTSLRPATDRRLKRMKYVVLAVVLAAAVVSKRWSDAGVEVEPFKTAITLVFMRSWPFAAYAIALLAAGVVVHKFFCRYLCPLGALLAVGGGLRRFDWLARRAECGKPCQTCRHRCDYQAIDSGGRVDDAECFQCMECVAIYNGDELCAPRILARKGRRMVDSPERPPAVR